MRGARRQLIALVIVVGCAAGLSLSAWLSSPNWSNADSLFYESMSREVAGSSAQAARAAVFASALARSAIAIEPAVATRAWQTFESQFSRRRWLVPALAAAVRPLAGERALPDTAIVGYLVFGVMLFLLLASRFPLGASVAVVALCLALPPVREWALRPMTDGWGLAIMVGAVLAALVALRRGLRWLPLWLAAMLALSITRDLAIVPFMGLAWIAYRYRRKPSVRRRALVTATTGVLVSLPAYLLFGASLRLTLAFQMHDWTLPIPEHGSWAYVAAHYPNLALSTVKADIRYAVLEEPIVGLSIVAGVIALFAVPIDPGSPDRDALVTLMRGAAAGWLVLFALDPDYSRFRYELPLVPIAAVGLCAGAEQLAQRYLRSRGATRPEAQLAKS